MFIPPDRLEEAYAGIKQGALESNAPVLIFVAPDADGLCACKILLNMFKADYISYKIVPVAGYTDLSRANEELIDGNVELRSIVMVNCGGMVDLTELLSLEEDMTVYLIDSHRPMHLQNVFGSAQIRVLDDGEIEEDMIEEKAAFDLVEFDDDDSDSGSEGEDLGEEEEGVGSDGESGGDGEDGENSDRPRKIRKLGTDRPQNTRVTLRNARRKLASYYSGGTFHGGSVAGIVYALATQLARDTADFLWLAIVGLTEQFIFERIERERYVAQYELFQDEVTRLSPPIIPENASGTADNSNAPYRPKIRNPDQKTITCDQEYRFMHFRHWCLYDSLFHSSYVASKLGVWREKGRSKLLNFLTKMGVSKPQFRQPYKHMDIDLRNVLCKKIDTVAPEYGLYDLQYGSFTRTHGWEFTVSASDVVYGITALLECSPAIAATVGAHIDWTGEGHVTATEIGGMAGVANEDAMEQLGKKFYTALDALDSTRLLRAGVDLSMRLQRVIVKQGTSMIERHSVKTLKFFRLAVLRDEPDLQILCHPLTLAKLGLFLVDTMREYRRTNLPFVIAALDERQDCYCVVGIAGSAKHGDIRKNNFGLSFQSTAARTGARVKHDSFETSVLEIRKEDLAGFMESLQTEMRV